jgi:hypothetical protein
MTLFTPRARSASTAGCTVPMRLVSTPTVPGEEMERRSLVVTPTMPISWPATLTTQDFATLLLRAKAFCPSAATRLAMLLSVAKFRLALR